jgi:hypothetical protein
MPSYAELVLESQRNAATVATTNKASLKGIQFEYNALFPSRKHTSLCEYDNIIEPIRLNIDVDSAIQFLTWANGWNLVRIYGLPVMSKKEIIEDMQLKFTVDENALNNENAQLKQIFIQLYQTLSSIISTNNDAVFNTKQTITYEIFEFEYRGDPETVPQLLENVINVLVRVLVLDETIITAVPLLMSEFCVYHLLFCSVVAMSTVVSSAIMTPDTILIHIFGMLVIDFSTDLLTNKLWLPRRTIITDEIMHNFAIQCPKWKSITHPNMVSDAAYQELTKFLDKNPQYSEYSLLHFLISANFPIKTRLEYRLSVFQRMSNNTNLVNDVYEKLETYLNQHLNHYIIYGIEIFHIIRESQGIMDLILQFNASGGASFMSQQQEPKMVTQKMMSIN